jgi:hypothetical protein
MKVDPDADSSFPLRSSGPMRHEHLHSNSVAGPSLTFTATRKESAMRAYPYNETASFSDTSDLPIRFQYVLSRLCVIVWTT